MTIKNIVIIGGGFAGIQTANALEKALTKNKNTEYRIILVEKKSHFYHAIAGLRCAVLDWDKKVIIPYTSLFQNKKNLVVQASVVQLEKNEVVLDQQVADFGNAIPYDYLIIATGTKYPAPAKASGTTLEEIRGNLIKLRSEIKNAQSVVIVGGGPVGIELAGEIRDVYSKTKITIIHDQPAFLDDKLPKIRQKLLDLATDNKIDTLFGESVVLPKDLKESYFSPENKQVVTQKGTTVDNVDLVLLAFGNRPDTAWLKNSDLGSSILAPNGYVKVKKSFQVDHPELSNVFVLGDAADFNETKLAFRITGHVPVVVENIIQLAVKNGKPTAEYKKGPDGMFITFGKSQGAGQFPMFGGLTVGNWMVSNIKAKTLFTGNSWKTLNLKEPSDEKKPHTFTTLLFISAVVIASIGIYAKQNKLI